MLEIKNLNVKYGERTVINDMSFSVEEGHWLMITGPNGSGKSTLLKAISQALPYAGEVLLDGRSVKEMKPLLRARKIGILSQNHFVSYDFTVQEIVELGRYAYGRKFLNSKNEEDREAVEKSLRATGLFELRNKTIGQLSGGEVQRVFLAQVFSQDPRVLLLDEPTNHLDLTYVKQIFELIEEWLKTPGRMVISAVHDLSLAKTFGTEALLINHGEKISEGAADRVLSGEKLNQVYKTDVAGWMKEMYAKW